MLSKAEIFFLMSFQIVVALAMIAVGTGGFFWFAPNVDSGAGRAGLSFAAKDKISAVPYYSKTDKQDTLEINSQNSAEIIIDSVAPAGAGSQGIRFEGRALPGADVAIHIFSVPLVAMAKADDSGRWSFVLDRNLNDGNYLAYAAVVDSQGAILSKSADFIFNKNGDTVGRAIATGENPYLPTVNDLKSNFAYSTTLAILLSLTAALIVIGLTVRRAREGKTAR
ncbi:MAG: hypothetical protein WCX69_00905 [Candidatus Paceibacterota bacterium]